MKIIYKKLYSKYGHPKTQNFRANEALRKTTKNYYIDNNGWYRIPINNPYESVKKIDLTIFMLKNSIN